MSVPGKKDKKTPTTDTTTEPKNKIYQAIPQETREAAVQAVQGALNPSAETTGTPAPEPEKVLTIEEMLEERRQAAKDERTDAQKMQRFYALADAMKALGKMGGAAVGGAIGGDALAGATPVEYKPNRGYLDAVERAKKASDRLRSVDDTGFQLAVSKQQRDEERAYQTQKTKDEREYQAQRDARQREWDKELLKIKAEIEKAALEGNYKLKEQLETKMATMQQQFKKDMAAIEHRYNMTEKSTISAAQQAQLDAYNKIPLAFDDGTAMNLTRGQQDGMRQFFIGKEIGGVYVDKDNVDAVIRANPQLAREYMTIIGGATTTQSTSASGYSAAGGATAPAQTGNHQFPQHISQVPLEYMNAGQNKGTAPAQTNGGATPAPTTQADNGQDNKENDSRIQIDW